MESRVFKAELTGVRDRFLTAGVRIVDLTLFPSYARIVFGTHRGRTEYLKDYPVEEIKGWANAFPDLQGYVDRHGLREGYWRWARSLPRKVSRLIYQQSLVFLVTIFEAFMTDALLLVFRKEPRCLSSERTVSWEGVIELGDYDSVINYFAAKRVDDILSGDWYKIAEEFKKLFNIDISGEIDEKSIAEIFEIRHAVVHNVALADQRFMNKVQVSAWGLKYALNKEIILNHQVLSKMNDCVTKAVFLIYDNLLRKFSAN